MSSLARAEFEQTPLLFATAGFPSDRAKRDYGWMPPSRAWNDITVQL